MHIIIKKRVSVTFLSFLLLVCLSHAATLTIGVEPADIGINTVTPSTGGHEYDAGQTVDLAAPSYIQCPSVYQFDHWTGDVANSNSASTIVLMDASKTVTAVFTLAAPVCGDQCHPNFTVGDLNHDCIVDLGDFAVLASRWMNCTKPECDELPPPIDFQPPMPNPAMWATPPYQNGVDSIRMVVATAVDPEGNGVQYAFTCSENPALNSGWISNTEYVVTGLIPWQTYTFRVKYRDNSVNLNETDFSNTAVVNIMTIDVNPPLPNPAQWEYVPYQNTVNTIRMVAQAATDPEGNGVLYAFSCAEDISLNSGWITSNQYVTPATLMEGQTYTFRVKYRDNSINQNETAYSSAVAVTISGPLDFTPPMPNPPTITAVRVSIFSQMYHVVTASVATDPSGVEYQFECLTSSTLIATAVHVDWINTGNIVAGIYPFNNDLFPNGTLKIPNRIYIPVYGTINHTYRVRTRDQSPAQNTSAWSSPVTTQ